MVADDHKGNGNKDAAHGTEYHNKITLYYKSCYGGNHNDETVNHPHKTVAVIPGLYVSKFLFVEGVFSAVKGGRLLGLLLNNADAEHRYCHKSVNESRYYIFHIVSFLILILTLLSCGFSNNITNYSNLD